MRKALLYTAIILATSCNADLMESSEMGSISLSLYSDVEVVADTKADAQDYSDFLVDIYGETYLGDDYPVRQYVYGSIPEAIEIPFGYYHISAQSCTEIQAEDGYGRVRYFGESAQVDVLSDKIVSVTVACKMANGKVTMTFDESFQEDFTDITVDFTVASRTVSLTEEDANLPTEVYFNTTEEGADLVYRISGTVAKGTDQEKTLHYSNSASPTKLFPGKWAKFTIKSNHNGIIGPGIEIDDNMEKEVISEIIDPEEGLDNGEMPAVTIQVDTQMDDATVVDCVIDVY